MPQESENFLDVIERAQRVSGDLNGVFGTANAPARVAFDPRGNRGNRAPAAGPDMDFDAHCEVFALPADKEAYVDVLNQVLRGEAIIRYEDRTFSKEGDFMVAMVYMTPRTRVAPANNQDAGDAEPEERARRL